MKEVIYGLFVVDLSRNYKVTDEIVAYAQDFNQALLKQSILSKNMGFHTVIKRLNRREKSFYEMSRKV